MIPTYESLTDDEVLKLALESGQLTDEAKVALESELAKRKLSSEQIWSFARLRAGEISY